MIPCVAAPILRAPRKCSAGARRLSCGKDWSAPSTTSALASKKKKPASSGLFFAPHPPHLLLLRSRHPGLRVRMELRKPRHLERNCVVDVRAVVRLLDVDGSLP